MSQWSYKSSPSIRFHDVHRDKFTFIPNLGSLLLNYTTISRLKWRRIRWKDDHLLFSLYGLFKEVLSNSNLYCPICGGGEIEWERREKKMSWPSFRYFFSICLTVLITNHESTSDRKVAVRPRLDLGNPLIQIRKVTS
jgi:hypothetical protein